MFKHKSTILILAFTFVTVFAWIGLSIYHIWVTSTISNIDASAIIPINPKFDTEQINNLKTREVAEPLYQFNLTSDADTSSASASTDDFIPEDVIAPTEITIPQISEGP